MELAAFLKGMSANKIYETQQGTMCDCGHDYATHVNTPAAGSSAALTVSRVQVAFARRSRSCGHL